MYFRTLQTPKGFSLSLTGPAWQADSCEFRFPEHVWKNFPAKQALINELAYICTLPTPLILKYPEVEYDTAKPQYFELYNHCFNQSIPNLVESIQSEKADAVYHLFHSINREFHGEESDERIPANNEWDKNTVVLPLSYGKDSLLSMATLRELGYKVVPVYVDERVLPRAKAAREKLGEKLKEQFGIHCHTVENELHLLCDYEVLEKPVTELHRLHIYFVYLLAMLPFCYYYRAPTIVFNNEYHHNLLQLHKDGYLCLHRYMQSAEAVKGYDDLVRKFSSNQIKVVNLIGVLNNYSIYRILYGNFPELRDYQVSCQMDTHGYDRWCHKCYRCARAFMFFMAMGIDPFIMDFKESMLSDKHKKHFAIFNKDLIDEDQYRNYMAAEEELVFIMAVKNGASGPLIDLFRSKFKTETSYIEKRGKKLKNKIFRLQAKPGATTLEKNAAKLYKKILKTVSYPKSAICDDMRH